MEGHVLKNVRKFCKKMMQQDAFEKHETDVLNGEKPVEGWSQAKNMTLWADYLAFDIMGDLCFSRSFDMLDSSENHYMLDVLPAGVQGLNIVSI